MCFKAIVVTGTPGTGKTVFSKRLSKLIGYRYLDLNDYLIREKCIEGFDSERGSYVVDLNAGRERLLKSLEGKFIVDSHVSHLVVPKERVEVCFVLRASPYELMSRLRARGMDERKVLENCLAEILDVILSEALERYGVELVAEIDTTGRSFDEVVNVALRILRGESERRVGLVNWLKLVYERGDLSFFQL